MIAAINRLSARFFPKAGCGSRQSHPSERNGSVRATVAASPRLVLVDQVWSGLSDEGEEYLVLRLSKSRDPRPSYTEKIRSLPTDRSHLLLAAAKIAVTLDFDSPLTNAQIVTFRDDGVH